MRSKNIRYGLILNPTAGQGRGRKIRARLLEELAKAGLDYCDLSQSTASLAFRYATQREKDYDALIVVGGDGMVHLGLNLVAGTNKPLGIIAIGSGNDFARHLHLPIRNLTDSIRTITINNPRPVDAMKLTPIGAQKWNETTYNMPWRWAGGVVSAGFDSQVNSRANGYAWPKGHARYVRGVLRELPRFHPYPYVVNIDEDRYTFRGALVAVANTPSFGGGLKIAPHARLDSGQLEVVMAHELTRWQLLRVFPKLYAGAHTNHPVVTMASGHNVTIGADKGGIIPEIFADGERIGAGPVKIEVAAGAVQILCPRLEV